MSPSAATIQRWLGAGFGAQRRLDAATRRARHAGLVVALTGHVPVLIAVAVAGTPGADPVAAAGPVTVALIVALGARTPRVRAGAVAAGLAWCSGVLVGATGGAPLAHLHLVVVLVAVSLYEDWAPLLLVAATGVLAYALGGWLAPAALFGPGGADAPALLVPLATLCVAATAVAACAWWRCAGHAAEARQDATARVAERERAVAAELALVEAVKDELLAVVSHEFRTPLASIAGLARTLAARSDELDRDHVRACLAGIDHHTRRLAQLVQNVVAVSGNVDVDHTAVTDLHGVVRDAVAEALAAHGRRVRVHVDLPPALEAGIGTLAACRILSNLCDNAVKFAPEGGLVEITGARQGGTAVVALANDARGMSPELLQRCFQPFVQADSSDTRAGEGIGLGLHVARRVARAHGGGLGARVCGDRVVFELSLPLPGRTAPSASERRQEEIDSAVC